MQRKGFLLVLSSLLLLSGCLPKQPVVSITAAENIRRSSDGRIFVTGRHALYEVSRGEGGLFQAAEISRDEQCDYHSGIAQLRDWLFFVCARQSGVLKGLKFADSGSLKAFSLTEDRVVEIMEFSGFQFTNGIDALPAQDAILVADEDFLGAGGVARVKLDFSSGVPVLLDYQKEWIGPVQRVYAANGVRVHQDAVYLTDVGFIKRVPLDVSGEPEQAQKLYRANTVFDDLDIACNGVLAADFVGGRLVHVPFDGSAATVSQRGLTSPSAVLADATPLFDAGEILVTETVPLQAGDGHQVVRVPRAALGIPGCQ